ncbi:structure-specific endonuclease subunit SLX1 [Osmia lignaria lignaria]|uniref:structure-specific endonuclease subunit SLX1 n=1 Tax=Osmia lignaria lignaria TaxID=1437193 RepID=UPI001478F9C3|nr:structure-specific endonuclease subunit slx1 [Osmia lignaria]
MEDAEVIEHFYGVYLLYCTNPKYKGRTYIGYTVDPRRRLKQHNAGKEHKGAWKTSNRGPWNMVLIIHGFPNSTSALRFEWAWQHPYVSRRLKHIPKKKSRQRVFEYHLIVLSEMLKVGPWCRLPLTIRWLDYEFFQEYSYCISAPMHMPICCGKVISQKIKKVNDEELNGTQTLKKSSTVCSICGLFLEKKELVTCVKPNCLLEAHLICLAKVFCKDNMILPIEGTCPTCNTNVLWGDLIRKKIGCYENLQEISITDNYASD